MARRHAGRLHCANCADCADSADCTVPTVPTVPTALCQLVRLCRLCRLHCAGGAAANNFYSRRQIWPGATKTDGKYVGGGGKYVGGSGGKYVGGSGGKYVGGPVAAAAARRQIWLGATQILAVNRRKPRRPVLLHAGRLQVVAPSFVDWNSCIVGSNVSECLKLLIIF